jgi:predicted ArsR family transcriptional regulator
MLSRRRTFPALAALEDDTRRRLFLYVRGQGDPVTREDAAMQVGISERLAAYHLDKLVKFGLLRAHYARKPGRSGPGAGRTSKYYEPSDFEADLSIPQRRYAFIGETLVEGIAAAERGEPARAAAIDRMNQRGVALGREARRRAPAGRPGKRQSLEAARRVLARFGFEPVERSEGTISLRNCPYERLSRQAPEVVCRMNHAFVEGILRGLGGRSVEAALDPTEGECCVKLVAH